MELQRIGALFPDIEKISNTRDEFLRLKRLADKFVSFYRDSSVSYRFVDDARHEDDWSFSKLWILLDLAADRVTILVGHNDIGNDDVGRVLFELIER